VLAKSFARIHRANLINFGILPLTFAQPADSGRVGQGDELRIGALSAGLKAGRLKVEDATGGFSFDVLCALSEWERDMLAAGGRLNMIGK